MVTIYTEREAFENIVFYESENLPMWNKTLSSNLDICVNMTDDELDQELNDPESPSSLFLLSSASAKTPVALNGYFDAVKEELSQVAEHPQGVFVLDIDPSTSEEARQTIGSMVISMTELSDDVLLGGIYKDLPKGEFVPNGWAGIVGHGLPALNSLILSDDYLFQNEENGQNCGSTNLSQLMDAVLPNNLSIPFHLTIVAGTGKKPTSWWNKETGTIMASIKALRKYDVQIEIVLGDTIHKRWMFSNYFVSWTDKGFSVFKNSKPEEVRDHNDFYCYRLFHNVLDSGDSHYIASQRKIKELHKICSSTSKYVSKQGQADSMMIYGDCAKDKTIQNRLLNDF